MNEGSNISMNQAKGLAKGRFRVSFTGCERRGAVLADALVLQWRHGFPTMPKGMNGYTHGFHPLIAGMVRWQYQTHVGNGVLPL